MRCPLCDRQANALAGSPVSLALCPNCGSSPQDRELAWFLKNVARPPVGTKVLDIGPSSARLLQAPHFFQGMRYTAIDIDPDPREGGGSFSPGQRFLVMDVTRLSFSEQSFPLILAPFVLAEVRSDYMAMWALHRCLHNDGMAVLTEPMARKKTDRFGEWQAKGESLPAENQGRPLSWVYGEDYLERLEAAGFFVHVLNLHAEAGAGLAKECAFRPKPELVLAFKFLSTLEKFREAL